MKTIKVFLLLITCIMLSIYGWHICEAQISSDDTSVREKATRRILDDRTSTIENLQDIAKQNINNPQKKEVTKTAIILLGKLHASESIPFLLDHLSFSIFNDEKVSTKIHAPEEMLPAMGALIAIGSLSLDPALERASDTDNRENDELYDYMLVRILGNEAAVAYVQSELITQQEPVKRERLKKLYETLKKYPFLPKVSFHEIH